MGILLAPYDDSMRLGQGYNSFLQTPCVYDAVKDIKRRGTNTNPSVDNSPQTVSYSSHIISRISDVARSMGISTGSTVKNGSIALSGNASSIDESKFAESHMNVVVSVKVINQTIETDGLGSFNSDQDKAKEIGEKAEAIKTIGDQDRMKAITDVEQRKKAIEEETTKEIREMNKEFHQTYGDCYISGFVEGGNLHGVVSIRVLDLTKKEDVKARITRDLNSADPAGMGVGPSSFASTLHSRISGCETTIAVNWSGGGWIKPDDEEWSIESLFQVAAAFPAKVAACPRRTWAILTPYNNNSTFSKWAIPKKVKPYDYRGVSSYAAALLDTYMSYKNNIRRIQSVLDSPRSYMPAPGNHPIEVTVEALVGARKDMRDAMVKIMKDVDRLNDNPGTKRPENIQPAENPQALEYKPQTPEEWAVIIPVPHGITPQVHEALGKFALLDGESYSPPDLLKSVLGRPGDTPAGKLYDETAGKSFTKEEIDALSWEFNRRILKNYRFTAWPVVLPTTKDLKDVASENLGDELRMNAVFADRFYWPSSIHIDITHKGDIPVFRSKCVFGKPEIPASGGDYTPLNLEQGERIDFVRIGKTDGSDMIAYVKIKTSKGHQAEFGKPPRMEQDVKDYKVPSGCKGLAFFIPRARYDSGAVGRLLLVWK